MSKMRIACELFCLLKEKRAWWLIPMAAVFLTLSFLLVLTQSSALGVFIYPFM